MPSQEMLATWEKAARAEDVRRKEQLKSGYHKICRLHAKRAMRHPDSKITLSLTAGELDAIRQFMIDKIIDGEQK